jgi:hypothetical protein
MIIINETTYGRDGDPILEPAPKSSKYDEPEVQKEKKKLQDDYRNKRRDAQNAFKGVKDKVLAALGPGSKLALAGDLMLKEWLKDSEEHHFNGAEDIVQELENKGLLYESFKGGHELGPKTLGKRPHFIGDAAKMKAGDGNDRRHVIAASTLGLAVEKSNASLKEVKDFITRSDPGFDTNSLKTEQAAKREVWNRLNSVSGNLWAGPSGDNRVAGFIRGPIKKARDIIEKANETDPDFYKIAKEAVEAINKPTGPLRQEDRKSWQPMADVMVGKPGLIAQQLEGASKGVTPPYAKEAIIKDLLDFEMNADLDLPHPGQKQEEQPLGKGYWEALSEIYEPLRATADEQTTEQTPNLFAVGGPLDQFMKLDCHNMELSASIVNNMRKSFEGPAAPNVSDVETIEVNPPMQAVDSDEKVDPMKVDQLLPEVDPEEKLDELKVAPSQLVVDNKDKLEADPSGKALTQDGIPAAMEVEEEPAVEQTKPNKTVGDSLRPPGVQQRKHFAEGSIGAEFEALKNKNGKRVRPEQAPTKVKIFASPQVSENGAEKPVKIKSVK